MYIVLFFAELFLLFLLSRQLTSHLSYFLYKLTRSKGITIHLLAFLFFPGTFLHELSHVLMAHLLFVPVHRIEFFPKLEGEHIKLGSVSIEKTDIFRSILIGMAPFFVGTTVILFLLFSAEKNHLFENIFIITLIGYFIFEIGNTMFSSRKDLEGAVELLLLILFTVFVFYSIGIRITAIHPQTILANPLIQAVFEKGSLFLLIPLAIDGVLIAFLGLLKFNK